MVVNFAENRVLVMLSGRPQQSLCLSDAICLIAAGEFFGPNAESRSIQGYGLFLSKSPEIFGLTWVETLVDIIVYLGRPHSIRNMGDKV